MKKKIKTVKINPSSIEDALEDFVEEDYRVLYRLQKERAEHLLMVATIALSALSSLIMSVLAAFIVKVIL